MKMLLGPLLLLCLVKAAPAPPVKEEAPPCLPPAWDSRGWHKEYLYPGSPWLKDGERFHIHSQAYYRCNMVSDVYDGKYIKFNADRVRRCCEPQRSGCSYFGFCVLAKDYVEVGGFCTNQEECKDNLPCIEGKCGEEESLLGKR